MFNVYNMNQKSDIAVFMKKKRVCWIQSEWKKKIWQRESQMWGAMCKKVGSCIEDFVQILDNYVIMRQYVQCIHF